MENNISVEYFNKSIFIAIYSTSLLLYTFFNTFFLCYVGLNENLDNVTLGLCIYFNVIFCLGFIYIFFTVTQKFLVCNLILYVFNTSLAFIMLGIVHDNNHPIIVTIVYGVINSLFLTVIFCRYKYNLIRYNTLTYETIV